ncbi:SSI family serine proteinase inhibitor [Actinosynnema sp. NPDC020468]|uniref:SSI family serine proteinase inhibitor n=1 Tax=Actinosynnema sp. NPDC020468 TaxID=3154488 RepID=UPI0033C9C9A0
MRRTGKSVLTAASAVVLVLAGTGAPAQAAEPSALFLSVSGSDDTWSRAIFLSCPAGEEGHYHPAGDQACADLLDADGDFDHLRGTPHFCTCERDPVVATAQGLFADALVSWTRTYRNSCALDAATGAVFRF